MFRASLAVALLLMPAASGMTLAFENFQFEGEGRLENMTALLLVWPPGSSPSFDVTAPSEVGWTRIGAARVDAHEETVDLNLRRHEPVTSDEGTVPAFSAGSLEGRGWGSLMILGDHISVETTGSGSGAATDPGAALEHVRVDHPYPTGTTVDDPPTLVTHDLMFTMRPDQGAVTVRAEGVHRILWHNASLDCGAGCEFDAGHSYEERSIGTADGAMHSYEYIALDLDGASLVGTTDAHALAAAGSPATLLANGTVRLPLAECRDCLDDDALADRNGTIRLAGLTRMEGFGRGGDRLHADVTGSWDSVLLDETVVQHPANAGVIEVAAFSLLGALVGFGGWLAVRLGVHRRGEASRQAIQDAIAEQPGIRFRGLLAATRLGNGTLDHHLHAMAKRDEVVVIEDGGNKHCFLPAQLKQWSWRQWVVATDDKLLHVADCLRLDGSVSQSEIIRGAERRGISRWATQRALARLGDAGFVRKNQEGRTRQYSLLQHPQVVRSATNVQGHRESLSGAELEQALA